ncbi:MAG: glycosyltransferase [Bryobacteraceae bacterium]|jgi:GT2 family glycosyltransferase/glycosyltransferase involved in cell wall biosynthesis
MFFLKRLLRALPLLILSPFLLAASLFALWLADVLSFLVRGARRVPVDPAASELAPAPAAASVVIPNWNGRDLLAQYLPSVVAALAGNPANEVIVVDNGSTDDSAAYVRAHFPQVKLAALERNLGFGGGSNAGFREAKNRVVVLLNNDMRVEPDFLAPLLEGFSDPAVFAVSCQIFFKDPSRIREETGLTQGWWQDGALRVRHRADPAVTGLFPCFYGGGGSCAFDRYKFFSLGGFDELYAPFYFEDTDLGYMAWKRGWKVLYQARSVVYHEHRGTIGKTFGEDLIQGVIKRNALLFAWKNIHEWRRVCGHFALTGAGAILSVIFGEIAGRPTVAALGRAFVRLPQAVRSRWRARGLAAIGDTEAFRRPLGGYFRDRFGSLAAAPEPLRVLFVSPYPICPPVHGGGVFMYQTLREMAGLAEVHVAGLLDFAWQEEDNLELRQFCASAEWLVRSNGHPKHGGPLEPYAVREFHSEELEWLIHRQIYLQSIDVVQLEYTVLAQYRCDFRRIPMALFEHDVYFQSIGRGLGRQAGFTAELKARVEYLRALRYELRALPGFDQVQVCTAANREYLLGFLPRLAPRIATGMRAGIDISRYRFRAEGRVPFSMLFVGSFRHDPNRAALAWFVHEVLPLIVAREPRARLAIVGSDPPPAHTYADYAANLEMLGTVADIREPLERFAVFVCPVLSGSGVRVKLLEAYAAGIPVVSTAIGAEGLAAEDGRFCALADSPEAFAARVTRLFADPVEAAAMATRARAEVEANWAIDVLTRNLVDGYRRLVRQKREA